MRGYKLKRHRKPITNCKDCVWRFGGKAKCLQCAAEGAFVAFKRRKGDYMETKYPVIEIFTSIQGEGAFQGEKATFIRFAGCNLRCPWCDTKHSFDGTSNVEQLTAEQIIKRIPKDPGIIVLTGGEPFLQDLDELIVKLNSYSYFICVETNGTINADTTMIDWITVSPKPPLYQVNITPNELKYVVDDNFEASIVTEDIYARYLECPIWLQVESARPESAKRAFEMIMKDSRLRLGTQLHKTLGVL